MKVAFDSRPAKDTRGIGRYTSCLLSALLQADRGEVVLLILFSHCCLGVALAGVVTRFTNNQYARSHKTGLYQDSLFFQRGYVTELC